MQFVRLKGGNVVNVQHISLMKAAIEPSGKPKGGSVFLLTPFNRGQWGNHCLIVDEDDWQLIIHAIERSGGLL